MKVKELVNKIADFGTSPHVYMQKEGIIGCGKPDVVNTFGEMTVNSFIAAGRGQIKIFVK